MAGFVYPYDIQSTLEPWREALGQDFDTVVARLTDRDRALEDYEAANRGIRVVTSTTRPAANVSRDGDVIFETDTDTFYTYDGTAWVGALDIGAWDSWTSTLTNLTLGSGSVTSRWTRLGRTVHYLFIFEYGAGSAVGTDPTFTLPVAPSASFVGDFPMGHATLLDAGAAVYLGQVHFSSGSTVNIRAFSAASTYVVFAGLTATVPFTWGAADRIMILGTYEAAA